MTNRRMGPPALIYLPHIESTNDFLSSLLAKSEPKPGTAITAEFQASGKGRFGKKWHSEPGMNLLLSVLLTPDFLKAREVFYLNMLLSVTVCRVLEKRLPAFSEQISVKWPNDILVDRKKICGLLIQNGFAGDKIQTTIAGLGLNVNQTQFEPFPGGLQPVSMSIIAGKNFDTRDLLFEVIHTLFQNLNEARKNRAVFRTRYLSLLRGGQSGLRFQSRAESKLKMSGKVVDIQDDGRALIDDGQFKKWISIDDWKMLVS